MKRTYLAALALLGGSLFTSLGALSAPVLEITHQLVQPDGSSFAATPKGDEWNNRVETAAGFTIARDQNGVWRYVSGFDWDNSPTLHQTPANQPAPPGLTKHLRSAASRPQQAPGEGMSSGSLAAPSIVPVQTNTPILFILTEFNDRKGSTTDADWATFVSNNIQHFYQQTSHGNAQMNPADETSGIGDNDGVIDWVNVGYNHPNTAGNTNNTNKNLTADAIAAADPYVDFASYDSNSDGYIDGNELSIVIIVAGYETAYGGSTYSLSPSVWGHKWGWGWPTYGYPAVDGVNITEYAQFGELHGWTFDPGAQHQATMGIMVHELGHLSYGLPDLYDTDGSSSGIGDFGVMSAGSWGRASTDLYSGETPVNASAWSKYHMNWVTGDEGVGSVSIAASGNGTEANTVFRASTGIDNQYFLVENRRPVGYDLGLEDSLGENFSGGLAIWHIDDSRTSNANDANRWVDLEEADGTNMGTSYGSNSDLWASSSGFDATSDPSSDLYGGTATDVAVLNISAAADTMTADFGGVPSAPNAPSDLSANAVSSTEINLIWNDNANNEDGFTVMRSLDGANWSQLVTGLPANTQSYNDTPLDPLTTYYYQVLAYNDIGNSELSPTASATTQEAPVIPGTPDSVTATEGTDGTVQLSWGNVDNETGFEIEREKAHKKRVGVWVETTLLSSVGVDVTSLIDASGTGTFRYRVRAFNNTYTSEWSGWAEVTVTSASGGGGGGGGGGSKPCRGKNCSP